MVWRSSSVDFKQNAKDPHWGRELPHLCACVNCEVPAWICMPNCVRLCEVQEWIFKPNNSFHCYPYSFGYLVLGEEQFWWSCLHAVDRETVAYGLLSCRRVSNFGRPSSGKLQNQNLPSVQAIPCAAIIIWFGSAHWAWISSGSGRARPGRTAPSINKKN